jgi:hypothetical protein
MTIVDVKDRTRRTMSCLVSCSCHKVSGRVKLHISESLEPYLIYDLKGWFRVGSHDRLLYCPECGTAVLTAADWITE